MSTVTRNLQNIDGANVTNPTANNFTTNGLAAYANDAAFEAATTPVTGSIYWNTTEKLLREYNGTSWQYDKFSVSASTDSTSTGANVDFTPSITDQLTRFTQGSLASIRSIAPTTQRLLWLVNDQASNGITFINESAGATAANRIRTPSGQDFVLQTGQVLTLAYDDEISRWRVVGSNLTGLEAFANDAAYATAHNPPVAGSRYFNTTSLLVREYDGTAWQNAKFAATVEDNTTLTGSNQDYTPGRNQAVRFSNASLASIRSVSPAIQNYMILVNATGNAITIKNQDAGATAANRIITGSGVDLNLTADSSIILAYDTVSSRWRIAGGSGSGGLFPTARSTTFTAAPGFHYQTDTSGGAFTATLPSGAAGSIIMFSDSTESWNLFQLTIAPASGQKIDGLANDETLVCDVKRGWVELSWNATGSFWSMRSLSALTAAVAVGSEAGLYKAGLAPGLTTGASVTAGNIGQTVSSAFNTVTAIGVANTFVDLASVALTAGVWMLNSQTIVNSNTNANQAWGLAISENSGNTTTDHVEGTNQLSIQTYGIVGANPPISTTIQHTISISTNKTMYLKAKCDNVNGRYWAGKITATRIA